ncbi:helix-turn-helix domain-containing protein [Streptomyces sp. SP18CM02]|uniref:helix-turn-helix domain-containing protein n=1 Tax=Streptomyces sp. SP18CM02 TaxID=2758571 RepID=UPI00168BBEB7|nr:helix-turn-helix transcriptional regulator [Streptomyces sp. SP18CM02]MBD3550857.1 helix-turn-helix transcriptional regulator [Streptomyces sp. SP18CM02]
MSKPTGKDVDPRDRAFGKRVAELRKERGMTQQQLAALLNGRTPSWMSQVERGIQPVRRFDLLQELADALGVSTQALDPGAPVPGPTVSNVQVVSNDLDAARMVIAGHPALSALLGNDTSRPDLDGLAQQVERIWSLTHEARFAEVSEMVTALIPALELAVRTASPEDRQSAYRLLARAYQALAAAFARQGDSRASWVSADRAVSAAELSGDTFLVFAGVYRMVHAFVRLGSTAEAEHAVSSAIDALSTRQDLPPEGLSVLGSLHLAKALVHARCSQRSEARAEIEKARQVAGRLGEDRNDYNLEFGPTNVAVQAVSTAVDLGDAGEALDVGASVNAEALSPERRGRLLMDLGRAHAQRRHMADAVGCLLRAEEISPETVQNHTAVREAVRELVLVTGSKASTELMELAERTGALD